MNKQCLLLIAALLMLPKYVTAETLTFGIVPQQSASKLARLWSPVMSYLSEQTGQDIRFATAKDIPTFEKRLAMGEYDLAYMNPYHYTVFNRSPGYRAFAKQRDKKIKGIMVVRKEGDITSTAQLSGSRLAFPSPAAFAASVLTRSSLRTQGITFEPQYVSSHDSVYLSVARGLFPAGGGVMRTFNNTNPEVRNQLKVLWTTDTYTPHAFAAHPSISPEVLETIAVALAQMGSDPNGSELLKSLNINDIQRASDGDWDDVRALGIDLLAGLID